MRERERERDNVKEREIGRERRREREKEKLREGDRVRGIAKENKVQTREQFSLKNQTITLIAIHV